MQAAIRFCCLAGLITLLAGCSKDNSSDPVLTLSTQNISLTGTILREQMEITTDAAWSISHDDAPWITVAPPPNPPKVRRALASWRSRQRLRKITSRAPAA